MALFSQNMSQPPSTFNPVPPTTDNTAADAINAVTKGLGIFAEYKSASDAAQAEQQSAQAYSGLFADTLRTEAEIIQGQEALEQNQRQFDALYEDGIISAEEQTELNRLQKDRAKLERVTNPRQRQVQLRMKYANFVNRFPHLTKEAKVLFGDAETRLDSVAQGAQGIVDQEAFENIYGKNYTARNISTFRNIQRDIAQRNVGTTYGEANFSDWRAGFEANVTADMFTIGQRMQRLITEQGSLRTEDIDEFNSQIQTGYMDAIQTIDQQIVELRNQGQYVSNEMVTSLKEDLANTRDSIMQMAEGKDFNTRLKNLNSAMEEMYNYKKNINLGATAKLFSGEGGGGAKGSADLATLKQLFSPDTQEAIEAAKNLPEPYGDQVAMLQEGAAKYLNFLDEYDNEAAAEYIAPSMARQLASVQATRVDNGITTDRPEAIKTMIDLMESGGSADETAEGILSRSKIVNQAAIKNNEAKARVTSFVNNYQLGLEEQLKGVGAKVKEENGQYTAYVTNDVGKLVPFQKGTVKLNNLKGLYEQMPAVGDMKSFTDMLTNYRGTLNSEIQELVQTLSLADMPEQVRTKTLNRLKTMYSLTDQEMQAIQDQIRSSNGSEESGG